jgi:hypothetical protein
MRRPFHECIPGGGSKDQITHNGGRGVPHRRLPLPSGISGFWLSRRNHWRGDHRLAEQGGPRVWPGGAQKKVRKHRRRFIAAGKSISTPPDTLALCSHRRAASENSSPSGSVCCFRAIGPASVLRRRPVGFRRSPTERPAWVGGSTAKSFFRLLQPLRRTQTYRLNGKSLPGEGERGCWCM